MGWMFLTVILVIACLWLVKWLDAGAKRSPRASEPTPAQSEDDDPVDVDAVVGLGPHVDVLGLPVDAAGHHADASDPTPTGLGDDFDVDSDADGAPVEIGD